ncbi:MAG TPA: hypothetical protein VNA19_12235 [Pyrinomonadaceae bacterium]|jgi:hypothetical protein|nr:hypothetical protein [Pyrinomonadaceae bacterium]
MPNNRSPDERRRARRFDAQLPVRLKGILVYSAGTSDSSSGNMLRVLCQTRDISARGLSLAVPAAQIDAASLPRESCRMLVILEIPTGAVALEAAPVHYKLIAEAHDASVYLIGASIEHISPADHARYLEYLRTLADF